ncbi:MAG: hypothetical protein ACXW3N_06150 [Rhodoplanes sp.]
MGILESHPADARGIDAVELLQHAAQPHAGGLAVGAHADAPSGKIGRIEPPARRIIGDRMKLPAAHHRHRDQHIGGALRLRLEIGHDRELAEVERVLAHQRLEAAVCRRDVGEGERDEVGAERAGPQGARVRIIAEQGVERRPSAGFGHRALYPPAGAVDFAKRAPSRL